MSDSSRSTGEGPRDLRASDVAQLIAQRIHAGEYQEGARLPTVRELAERYNINKNTASRAYQALERRGLIDMARGRGAFVRPQPAADGASWPRRAELLIHEAQQLGITRPQLLETLSRAIEQIYAAAAPRVLFVECNREDLQALGAELSQSTGARPELALLDEAVQRAAALARQYDLIVTTFQHLGQMRQATPADYREQVVGVHATPTHQTLLDLARLHVATFGLICDTPSTIEGLSHLIATYNPSATILPALIDDADQLRHVLARADAVVVTRSCRERLAALGLALPIVTVVFTIDQQSIDFLRRRIRELRDGLAR